MTLQKHRTCPVPVGPVLDGAVVDGGAHQSQLGELNVLVDLHDWQGGIPLEQHLVLGIGHWEVKRGKEIIIATN